MRVQVAAYPAGSPREGQARLAAGHATACCAWATSSMLSGMFSVSEEEAAAIRAVYEQRSELSAVELRRRFPGILDNAQARECARIIAGWKPLLNRPLRRKKTTPGT